jgi:hypothetical protein
MEKGEGKREKGKGRRERRYRGFFPSSGGK